MGAFVGFQDSPFGMLSESRCIILPCLRIINVQQNIREADMNNTLIKLKHPPVFIATAAVGGRKESEGPLAFAFS